MMTLITCLKPRVLPVMILGIFCFLSACGQKGPLFVPVKPPPASTPYPVAAVAVSEENRNGNAPFDSSELPERNAE